MSSPTSRSLKHLRDAGYLAQVVEHWVPGANVKRDLFGFIDVLCIHMDTGEVLAVQTTSYTNMSARARKIAESDLVGTVRRAGWSIHVHGWRKVGNRWQVKVKDVS